MHGVIDGSGLGEEALAAELRACGGASHRVVDMGTFPAGSVGGSPLDTLLVLLVRRSAGSGSGAPPAGYYLQIETIRGQRWLADRSEVLPVQLPPGETIKGALRLQVLTQGRNCSLEPPPPPPPPPMYSCNRTTHMCFVNATATEPNATACAEECKPRYSCNQTTRMCFANATGTEGNATNCAAACGALPGPPLPPLPFPTPAPPPITLPPVPFPTPSYLPTPVPSTRRRNIAAC